MHNYFKRYQPIQKNTSNNTGYDAIFFFKIQMTNKNLL